MYLGLSCYNHESAAALVNSEGVLIDFQREETLSRVKGDKNFPKRSIETIVENNNLTFSDIESIAFYERPLSAFLHPLKTAALNLPKSLGLLSHQFRNFNKSSISCYLDLAKIFPGFEDKLIYMDHHLSHTINALSYTDNKKNLCSIVVDGFGDRSTTSISQVNNIFEIKELWSAEYPVSLGLFYSAITDLLGFQVNEGEYKVMGLSAFGNSDSNLAKATYELVQWDSINKEIIMDMSFFSYHTTLTDSYSEKLVSKLGQPRNPFKSLLPDDSDFQRYADIARGAQDAIIEILTKIFEHGHSLTGARRFLFAGGVAQNSASLDSIASLPFVDEIIVPPSPGDSGSAIGSAYYAYYKKNTKPNQNTKKPSLFPSKFDSTFQIGLSEKILSKKFIVLTNNDCDKYSLAAKLISQGKVIGTIIGNSETGPRALGNRSLICNGKNHESVKTLNTVIKNRSPFRPTAPCMRVETAEKYYLLRKELIDSYYSMTATCKCRDDSGSLDFPTTHVDGTARLQIVEKGSVLDKIFNELETFDIDIMANSSLNLSGDPTCFDLIDGLMVCNITPLNYLLTDFGLLEYIG